MMVMLLITHIILAFASLGAMFGAVLGRLVKPAGNYQPLAQFSAVSFGGLFATGTVLVVRSHSPILGACIEGLAYFAILAVGFLV